MAAASMESAADHHHRAIIVAMRTAPVALSAQGIAALCALDYVQVNRRLPEMVTTGQILKTGQRHRNESGRLADTYILR